MSVTFQPSFQPTSKRRSFRPASFRPLDSASAAAAPPSLSTLNDNLRASLMNVGMRVRKSVPEGYKTASSKPDFDIYDQTAAAHPELLCRSSGNKEPLLPPVRLTSSPSSTSLLSLPSSACFHYDDNDHYHHHRDQENEMTDEQVARTVDDVLSGLDSDLADWSHALSSSQESSSSTLSDMSSAPLPGKFGWSLSSSSARRKRSLGYREEEEDDDEFNIWGGPVGSVPMERDAPLRQIAQAHSRRPQARRNASFASASSSSSSSTGKTGRKKTVRFAPMVLDDDF